MPLFCVLGDNRKDRRNGVLPVDYLFGCHAEDELRRLLRAAADAEAVADRCGGFAVLLVCDDRIYRSANGGFRAIGEKQA